MPAFVAISAIRAGDVEVDRLDDDRIDALGDDVLGLGRPAFCASFSADCTITS